MSTWKIVESTELYAGLGVQLLDDHTDRPIEAVVDIAVDIEVGASWRELELEPQVLPAAVFYFPNLERYRDAVGRPPGRYRVRVRSGRYVPLYQLLGGAGVVVQVEPWDDSNPPVTTLSRPEPLRMLPRPAAPFGTTPTLRGRVQTPGPDPIGIAGAIVSYNQPQPVGPPRSIQVLSEADGDYALPIRRIATPALTVSVASGGPPQPFPFPDWRTAVRTTQNLTL